MQLGPYELVRLIGSGGMGEVWAAHEMTRGPQELIAVKRLPDRLARDPHYRQTLIDEARLSMLLHHPNIVNVFEAGEDDGQTYIAMEFVSGLDLSRLRKILEGRGQRLRLPTVVTAHIISEVLGALDYAHNLVHGGELLSLIHRDISPHNIMLTTDGKVKLTDFGVARLSTEDTSGTHVKGKARYMPPEQLRGDSRSPTVDLFAVGAVMQELLDGTQFRAEAQDDARLLGMAIDGYVPPLARAYELPRELVEVLAGLLQPEPEARFPTASAALERLQAWPGFRDASAVIGDLIRRELEALIASGAMSSQTDLAKQATFLHTNDALEVEHAQPDQPPPDDFGGLDSGVMLESLLLSPEDPNPPAAPKTGGHKTLPTGPRKTLPSGSQRTLPSHAGSGASGSYAGASGSYAGPTGSQAALAVDDALELDLDDGVGPVSSGEPARDERAITGSRASLKLELDDTDRAAPRPLANKGPSPELAIDPHILRSPPASTGPSASQLSPRPRRPWGKYFGALLVIAGLGVGGYFAYPYIPGLVEKAKERVQPAPDDSPELLRYARVVGWPHPGYVGFRLPELDKLTTEGDIFYNFVTTAKTEAGDPLAAFAAGEAEFALTTLDQLLLAQAAPEPEPTIASAKVIAIVDLSLGTHGLVLDSAEYPQLGDLASLATFAAQAEPKPRIAFVEGSAGASLWAQLDALLAGVDGATLEPSTDHDDAAEVFAALAEVTPEPPAPIEGEETETGEPEPPPPPEPKLIAAMLPEPWLQQARAAGMKVALDSSALPYSLVTVLVASDAILSESPDIVAKVLDGYYAGLAEQSDAKRTDAVAFQLGLSADEAKRSLAGVCILDAPGAAAWLVERGGSEPPPVLADAVNAVWATLTLAEQVRGEPPELASFVDTGPLQEHIERQASAGPGVTLDDCLAAAGKRAKPTLGPLELGGLAGPWFDSGSTELNAAGQAAVEVLRARLHSFNPKSVRVRVTGYGEGGSGTKAKKLGKARAEAMVAALGDQLGLKSEARGAKPADTEGPLISIELVRP